MGHVVVCLILQTLPATDGARPPDLVGYWVEDNDFDPDCGPRGAHDYLNIELRPHGRVRLYTAGCARERRRSETGHWEVKDGRLILQFRSGLVEVFTFRLIKRRHDKLELTAANGTHYMMMRSYLIGLNGRTRYFRSDLEPGAWSLEPGAFS
jgi:hypothetical protein